MILGRSTVQWAALIAGTLAFVQIVVQLSKPEWTDESAIILPALGILLNGWIAFLANTATTPIADPRLEAGSEVSLIDNKGELTGDKVIVQPTPPGPIGVDDDATRNDAISDEVSGG